ncbi:MAG: PTS sugar transporter subunit IIB [Bacillota bacterium]
MSVIFYRIDDRLVHGQVMTSWTKVYGTNRIFVVDDATAGNSFLCEVMHMAAPREYDVHILKTADAIERIKNDPPDKKTMVLTKTPEVMLQLLEGGADMKELNVGGMGCAPGRRLVLRSIQISPSELETLKQIEAKGVRVYLQIFPDAKSIELSKVKL